MVAEGEGELTIPAIPFDFFDPIEGQYRRLHSDVLKVVVSGAGKLHKKENGEEVLSTDVSPLEIDIRPPRPYAVLTMQQPVVGWRPLHWLATALPLLLFGLLEGFSLLRAHLGRPTARSLERARRRRVDEAVAAARRARESDASDFFARLSGCARCPD